VAVFVIGARVAQPNPELILPLHAVFALAATAVAAWLPQGARPVAPARVELRHFIASPGLGTLVAAAALTGMGMGVNNTFLAVFLRDLGGPGWTLGAAFAIAAMGEVPLMANMQRLIHRFGVSRLVGVGLLVLPVRWGLYALLHSPWPILPLQLLHSVAIACLEVAGVLLVRDLTRPEWSATAQAFYGAGLMGSVGENFPAALWTALQQMGIDLRSVRRCSQTTPRAWQIYDAGEHRTEIFQSPRSEFPAFAPVPEQIAAHPDAQGFHLMTAELETVGGLCQAMRSAPGALILWEPAPWHLVTEQRTRVLDLIG